MLIRKINASLWLCNMKKKMTIFLRKEQGAEGRQTSEPENAHPTGEFVIVEKFGNHVLRRLTSNLSNVIRQADTVPLKCNVALTHIISRVTSRLVQCSRCS